MFDEFLKAAQDAIKGGADRNADFVRGSNYEALTGANALIWSQQVLRDVDMFRATRFNDSDGDDLTRLVKLRYGVDRVLDTRGVGEAILTRVSSGSSGTVWKGSRLSISGRLYRATEDVPVESTDTTAKVHIEAVDYGPKSLVDTTTGVTVEDPLWDASWTVASLRCSAGTTFEKAADLRERIRTSRRAARPGQEQGIIDACESAGAANVVLLRSDYGGDDVDYGLNVCYVGNLSYTGNATMVRDCKIALRSARVLGDHMQVRAMSRTLLDVRVTVTLRDNPAVFDTNRLETVHKQAIQQYLNGSSGSFTYTLNGIAGAIARNTPEVQDVTIATPLTDGTILTDNNFPVVLNRYVAGDIAITYA